MTARRKWRKLGLSMLMTIMLLVTLQPSATAAAIADCLSLAGTMGSGDQDAVIGEPFTLEYKLTPGGSYTTTVSREPIDIVLVLDTSGSMDYQMKKSDKVT